MKKRGSYILLIIILVCAFVLFASLIIPDEHPTVSDSISLGDGWEYSWDAFPRNSSGSIIWDFDTIANLSWEPIGFPSNPPGRQERNLVWFRIILPERQFRDPSLFIFSIDVNAEFYLDSNLFHRFGKIDQEGKGKFIGWPVQLFELPPDYSGRYLYVRVFSDYRDIGLWGKILLGNGTSVNNYMYRQDFFGLTVMVISLVIGLIFFITYTVAPEQKVSLYLSIITLLLSLRIFGQLYVYQRLIASSILPEYNDAFTSALIPLFITCAIRSFLSGKFNWLTSLLWKIYLGIFFIVLCFSIIPDVSVYSSYVLLDLGSILGVVTLGFISFRCLGEGTKEQKYISVNFLIMAMLVLYSLMMTHGLVPWISEFDYLMVFQFSVGLAVILGSRFFRLYQSYEKQSVELSTLNKRLENQVLQRTSELEEANSKLEEINARLEKDKKRLKVSSITDGLTGLYNRTYIEEQFRQIIKESSRYGKPFSISMLDLDHFKMVNDDFGHHVGDTVLRKVADTFHALIRETDIAGRYGGEEFLILFPQTDHDEAMKVTERIRKHIAELTLDSAPIQITISAGVAQYSGESAEEMLTSADKNLYAAKERGRNQIV